jgi:uncharacterized protein (TIGR00369 family)
MSTLTLLGPIPPAAELLGRRYLRTEDDPKRIVIAFTARETFLDLAGHVHGGLLSAMLDEVMTSTITAATGGTSLGTTISMSVDILHPVAPGPLIGEGTITLMGQNIGFAEGRLLVDGNLVARSTGWCRLVPIEPEWVAAPAATDSFQ